MKPCAQNRKRIAWLAANALDAHEANELQAHFKTCPGCREYWQELAELCREQKMAADDLPQARPGDTFHHRLVRRIRDDENETPAMSAAVFLRRWFTGWRIVVPAGALALVVLLSLVRPNRDHDITQPVSSVPGTTLPTGGAGDVQPTYSNYRVAANTSFEALDELLTKQAARRSWSAEVFTASAITTKSVGE
jgi:hypothetical protein